MRVDLFLTETGHTQSRQRAKTLIEGGCVRIDGRLITKPSQSIDAGEHTVELVDPIGFVGRGGLKLAAALDAFGIDPKGLCALDIGASTGGFTDCLLHRGAAHVHAVDAGAGQLANSLATDPRVTSIEHCNARELTLAMLGGAAVDLIVMDVSFISATYILPRYPELLREGGQAVVLIKPQFEVGRAGIGKGGIVKDVRAHREAVERVLSCGIGLGLIPIGLIASPIEGGDGNREFLVYFSVGQTSRTPIGENEIRSVTGARKPV